MTSASASCLLRPRTEDVRTQIEAIDASLGHLLDEECAFHWDGSRAVHPRDHALGCHTAGAAQRGGAAEQTMGKMDGLHARHLKPMQKVPATGNSLLRKIAIPAITPAPMSNAKKIAEEIGAALARKGMTPSDLARICGVTPQAAHGWVRTGRVSKHRLPAISKELSIPIDVLLGSPVTNEYGEYEKTRISEQIIDGNLADPLSLAAIPIGRFRRVVVTGAVAFNDVSFEPVRIGETDGFLNWPTSDAAAYALRCVGEAIAPRVRHGEFIVLEPGADPIAGDEVLVRHKDGRVIVRELVAIRDGMVKLLSINDGKSILISMDEIDAIHFVAGIARRAMWRARGAPSD